MSRYLPITITVLLIISLYHTSSSIQHETFYSRNADTSRYSKVATHFPDEADWKNPHGFFFLSANPLMSNARDSQLHAHFAKKSQLLNLGLYETVT